MIEHLKSGLSVSTHIGCPMGCPYCVLSKLDEFKEKPERSMTPEAIIETLKKKGTLFLNGKTPLLVNNRTDPLLPAVLDDTMRLLELFVEESVRSPILIISKFPLDASLKHFFEKLNLLYIYSYSNIVADFNYTNLKRDLEIISKNVPEDSRFHYFRPIIPGYNDDLDQMIGILKKFSLYRFSGSIITGFRVTSENRKLLPNHIEYDPHHKIIKPDLYDKIISLLAIEGLDYPVYRHTSCMIAAHDKKGCQLLYFRRKHHCSDQCSNYKICYSVEEKDLVGIKREIEKKFGNSFICEIEEGTLAFHSPVSQEQVAYIKNAYGIKVQAKDILLSPSEREILQ